MFGGGNAEICDAYNAPRAITIELEDYPSDETAIAASQRSLGTVLPYLNRPSNIKGSYQVLIGMFGREGADDVIAKNPGILACDPRALKQAEPDQIANAANVINTIETLPIPPAVRNNADKIVFFIGAAAVAKRILIDCAGQSCGLS